jgi:hypothetical protein
LPGPRTGQIVNDKAPATQRVLDALARHGLLLKQDKAVPSVVGIITRESLRTSWWSHPQAHLIFSVLSELADHPDVLSTKLLFRKDTLIHRSLWPSLLAMAGAREPWQLEQLSRSANSLLRRIDLADSPVRATGATVKELEMRLLARVYEIHTESGRHALVLESWQAWSRRVGCGAAASIPHARHVLEQAATAIGAPLKALAWRVARRSA